MAVGGRGHWRSERAVQEAIFLNRSACVKAIGFELHLAPGISRRLPAGRRTRVMRYKVTTYSHALYEQVCVCVAPDGDKESLHI